jgi:hypothetical protein
MGTFFATSLLAVPFIAWMSGTLFLNAPTAEGGANLFCAARGLPKLLEILVSCGRHAVDEVNQ